ncbi:DNA helicase RecQ [Granulicatella elegans]|uniref:DNA helicase RecQ n=1 Tax=Granulicatella elegans TaxID=137732 RepID=UPI001D142801|nr:DNA helicase RecQ [Granulicatella elegans]UEA31528.1 DNA helicase RecQ [Granulicatella elegans]
MNKEGILKHYYGYDSFRPAQAEIIETILSKRDVLAIMPTSAGKSICFQVPALMLEGITIVVSPLISLMYDQVTSLREMGIQAVLFNSAMSRSEYYQAMEQLQRGEVKLLYVAPERFEQEGFLEMMQGIQISMVAVDEAHCISQWGQDFRPSYQNIDTFVAQLPTRPIVAAFTATATPRVRLDIKQQLKLQHPFEVVTSFDRANLYFGMEEPRDKMSRLLELIKEKEPTIVFCNTRKEVEKVCEKLQKKGIAADWYHAGLSPEARSKVQEDFIFDRIDVIVATNAFGMGIDKSNVRKVIHYNMPKDIESYYQEAGRAGRDGEPAECILLYGAKDIIINKFLVKQNQDKVGMAKLNEMIDYCRTVRCLRGFMLNYFGQKDISEDCGHCTNCLNKVELSDVTPQAQMILSCIIRMKERYGMSKVSEVLRGSKRAEMKALHFDQLSTYGIMKDYSDKALKEFISSLIADRYIETEGLQYPILQVSDLGKKALKNREKIEVKPIVAQILQKPDAIQQHKVQDNVPFDEVLFDRLRSIRMDLAFAQHVPPFLVFSDKTLKEFCRHLPTTDREFLQISGVGEKKLETYGEAFMKVIREYKQ